jgi:hypothetical protein
MKAIKGMTPFEAPFGKKPNLSEWGENFYVRVERGTKLGGRVQEGRWLGIDKESKGARIYWLDTKSVTVKQSTYSDNTSANCFEEEEAVEIIKMNAAQNTPGVARAVPDNTSTTDDPPADVGNPENNDPDASDTESTGKCIRKPSKKIVDLLGGKGLWSTQSRPMLAPGVQQPSNDWATSVIIKCEEEHASVAETSSAEVLEPCSLAEAQKRPDWPLWEKAIHEELAMLKAAGTWEIVDAPKGVNVVGSKWVF